MKRLDDMVLFAKVVEAGSFSAAGRELGLQTSLLSRRIAALERALDVRLLNRSTRKLSLTETGRGFYQHCQALAAEAAAAWEAVERTRSAPRGLVRMSCPVELMRVLVARIVARFMADFPEVRVHIDATNRRVDVIEEGFDLALRVRTPPLTDSELVVRQLAVHEVAIVAASSLFAGRSLPLTPADLTGMPTLAQTRAGDQYLWELTAPGGDRVAFRHVPRLAVDDFPLLLRAAIDGLGITCLPVLMVREELAAGSLVRVLPDHELPHGIVHAVFPSRRGMLPAVRALLDALAEGFKAC